MTDDFLDDIYFALHVGDEVYWTDPEGGFASGNYKVVSIPGGISCFPGDVILIANEHSEAEVFRHELS